MDRRSQGARSRHNAHAGVRIAITLSTLSTLLGRSVVYQQCFTNTETKVTLICLVYMYGICIDTQLNVTLMDLHECTEKFKEVIGSVILV